MQRADEIKSGTTKKNLAAQKGQVGMQLVSRDFPEMKNSQSAFGGGLETSTWRLFCRDTPPKRPGRADRKGAKIAGAGVVGTGLNTNKSWRGVGGLPEKGSLDDNNKSSGCGGCEQLE